MLLQLLCHGNKLNLRINASLLYQMYCIKCIIIYKLLSLVRSVRRFLGSSTSASVKTNRYEYHNIIFPIIFLVKRFVFLSCPVFFSFFFVRDGSYCVCIEQTSRKTILSFYRSLCPFFVSWRDTYKFLLNVKCYNLEAYCPCVTVFEPRHSIRSQFDSL